MRTPIPSRTFRLGSQRAATRAYSRLEAIASAGAVVHRLDGARAVSVLFPADESGKRPSLARGLKAVASLVRES